MNIKPFAVEEWMNAYEDGARYNIAETCVDSVSLDELFSLAGEDKQAFLERFCARRLTYGDIVGSEALRKGICGLYKSLGSDEVVPTHGAAGANYHVFCSLIAPGDGVVSIMPTYQQLYSIPESIGATVKTVPLNKENNFLPDLELMRKLVTYKTKIININNPNNPSGAVLSEKMLREIVNIARSVGAYVLCDEVYRGLTHDGSPTPSIVDLYDKGISVGSMSKVFSLSGLRTGWIVSHAPEIKKLCHFHRDYSVITCGVVHDMLAGIALQHADKILERNRTIVRNNYKILEDWVATHPELSVFKPTAGTTAMVYFDLPVDGWEFCQTLIDEYNTLVTPGECFETPNSIRVGYACSEKELRDGLAQVDKYLATFQMLEASN